jgi:hypothetical protein
MVQDNVHDMYVYTYGVDIYYYCTHIRRGKEREKYKPGAIMAIHM